MDFEWRRNGETDLNKRKEKEWLTQEIAVQYYKKAQRLRNSEQDTGQFRKLKKELMEQCNVLEIEAINILRGFHISDYVKKYENLEKGIVTGDSTKFKANRELLLKMAELEDEVKNAAMANEGLYN